MVTPAARVVVVQGVDCVFVIVLGAMGRLVAAAEVMLINATVIISSVNIFLLFLRIIKPCLGYSSFKCLGPGFLSKLIRNIVPIIDNTSNHRNGEKRILDIFPMGRCSITVPLISFTFGCHWSVLGLLSPLVVQPVVEFPDTIR